MAPYDEVKGAFATTLARQLHVESFTRPSHGGDKVFFVTFMTPEHVESAVDRYDGDKVLLDGVECKLSVTRDCGARFRRLYYKYQ